MRQYSCPLYLLDRLPEYKILTPGTGINGKDLYSWFMFSNIAFGIYFDLALGLEKQ